MKNTLLRSIALCVLLLSFTTSKTLAQGSWKWGVGSSCPGSGIVEAWAVAADDSGNVYSGGFFPLWGINTMHFYYGSDSLVGGSGIIASTDSNGNYRWVIGTGNSFVLGTLYDHNNHIYVYGNSYTSTKIGADSIIGSGLFVAKLNLDGSPVWLKKINTELEFNFPGSITGSGLDGAGNIYLSGTYGSASITLGSSTLTNAGGISGTSDIAVVKLDTAGNIIWAKNIGGSSAEYETGVAVSPAGDVYVSGNYNSPSLTIGSTTLTHPSGLSYPYSFITKYDSSGAVQWTKGIIASGGSVDISSMALDAHERLYLTGSYSVNIICGTDSFPTPSPYGGWMFLVRYDKYGNENWLRSVGTGTGQAIAPDNCGNIWTAVGSGFFGDDVEIYKYDTSGAIHDTLLLAGGGDDEVNLAVDNKGNLYVGGDYEVNNFVIGPDTLQLDGGTTETLFMARYTYPMCAGDGILHTTVAPASADAVAIYPNPASGELYITSPSARLSKLEICDATGRVLSTRQLKGNSASISLRSIPQGMYYCRMWTDDGNITVKKLIVE